jgi:hypothetical protein
VIRGILFAAALSALSALDPCGLDLPGTDAGDDGGGGEASTSGTQTIGNQCTQIDTELCNQGLSRCALTYSLSDCVSGEMPQCCSSGNSCDTTSTSSQSDVDACKAAIDQADCNYIVNATFPTECQALLHP